MHLGICVFVFGWIVDVISFEKIVGLCGLKDNIGEIRRDVTLVHGRTDGRTESEDRARILETEFAKIGGKIGEKISQKSVEKLVNKSVEKSVKNRWKYRWENQWENRLKKR